MRWLDYLREEKCANSDWELIELQYIHIVAYTLIRPTHIRLNAKAQDSKKLQ